jgi:hypothetical protein
MKKHTMRGFLHRRARKLVLETHEYAALLLIASGKGGETDSKTYGFLYHHGLIDSAHYATTVTPLGVSVIKRMMKQRDRILIYRPYCASHLRTLTDPRCPTGIQRTISVRGPLSVTRNVYRFYDRRLRRTVRFNWIVVDNISVEDSVVYANPCSVV